jgi:hypothetical protein
MDEDEEEDEDDDEDENEDDHNPNSFHNRYPKFRRAQVRHECHTKTGLLHVWRAIAPPRPRRTLAAVLSAKSNRAVITSSLKDLRNESPRIDTSGIQWDVAMGFVRLSIAMELLTPVRGYTVRYAGCDYKFVSV